MNSKALDAFLVDRWNDSVGFVEAFHDFETRAMGMFEGEAGPRIREWFADKGLETEIEPKWAEVRAYRREWLDQEKEPRALLVCGGLLPAWYAKVVSPYPFLWVYLKGDPELIKRRAERLRGEAPIPSEWLHPETKHREPLGRYLEDVDNAERLRFMQDSSALTEFVTRRITPLLELEDRVARVLTVN